ncbi:MAG: efflux RND transporter periplasmic adaptor subunit [Gammaproteobacteria bacterium]|nr:efflux RND transporter periplasmic adaptor subunit [Gammaproteobacteria bacterium]MXY55218.1 efflux RND transporter periplasmic adaptor subunit [Gammaproteobacteria bacterium]MYF28213.1 efflux RND transporter periplasmic adaptor subunit [Gammaproteobacteria bacterium]MYK45561.1 efflux RND transporter periplasmic adaptor subunit [Gammaproteobacteria bacterium]
MRGTYITALVISVFIGIWLLSGFLTADDRVAEHPSLAEANGRYGQASDPGGPTPVRARTIHASKRSELLTLRGRTENKRTVEVRAETTGRVVARPVERGDEVRSGDLLCQIAAEDRQSRVDEGDEGVKQARLEYAGSLKLKDRGLQSETAIAQARARLATAEARREAAALDLDRTYIRAPFEGVVEDVQLEVGDYAQSGTPCARIVDLDPMLLVGQLTERTVDRVALGSPATGRLSTGAEVSGTISFVGYEADPGTRTYRVEVMVPNADYRLRSGVTTQIDIRVGDVLAHKITPAVFALNDEGRLGVRIVGPDDRVQFRLVDVVADDRDGVWVTGLPQQTRLITVGQEFVTAGERVLVQMANGPAADDSPDSPVLASGEADAPEPS